MKPVPMATMIKPGMAEGLGTAVGEIGAASPVKLNPAPVPI
ncbi:hypothetical protein [Chamaesiphon sp. GL140_3_metabinner_50]|nr:hypothetical protein [Chamaesiphon sp. GL140_3_metabinner_50]